MTEQFHWTSPDGIEIVLPRLGKVKASVLRKHRSKDGDDYMFSIIEDIADAETLAKIDDLAAEDFGAMGDEWAKSMGESKRSSS